MASEPSVLGPWFHAANRSASAVAWVSLDRETARKKGKVPQISVPRSQSLFQSRSLRFTYFYSWGLRFFLLKTELFSCLFAQPDSGRRGRAQTISRGSAWRGLAKPGFGPGFAPGFGGPIFPGSSQSGCKPGVSWPRGPRLAWGSSPKASSPSACPAPTPRPC